jgi:hypothetical protein
MRHPKLRSIIDNEHDLRVEDTWHLSLVVGDGRGSGIGGPTFRSQIVLVVFSLSSSDHGRQFRVELAKRRQNQVTRLERIPKAKSWQPSIKTNSRFLTSATPELLSGISAARSYRTLRDGSFRWRFPTHFVPGYDRLVPTGQDVLFYFIRPCGLSRRFRSPNRSRSRPRYRALTMAVNSG